MPTPRTVAVVLLPTDETTEQREGVTDEQTDISFISQTYTFCFQIYTLVSVFLSLAPTK